MEKTQIKKKDNQTTAMKNYQMKKPLQCSSETLAEPAERDAARGERLQYHSVLELAM